MLASKRSRWPQTPLFVAAVRVPSRRVIPVAKPAGAEIGQGVGGDPDRDDYDQAPDQKKRREGVLHA